MLPWKWILWKIGKLYPLFFLAFFKELSGDFLLVHDTKGHLILVNVQSASKVAGFNIYFNGSMIYRCETLRNLPPACGHPQHCRCEACLYVSLSLCLFILMKCKYSQLFWVLIDTVRELCFYREMATSNGVHDRLLHRLESQFIVNGHGCHVWTSGTPNSRG